MREGEGRRRCREEIGWDDGGVMECEGREEGRREREERGMEK